jgi:selenocysteine-specific elongation factor
VVCDPELDRTTDRLDAWVELRPAARQPLARFAEVRCYLGTAEVLGRIVWLDGREALAPKEATFAQLVLRAPIAAFGGDRFVLREATARATIGGGLVLHPFARKPATRTLDAVGLERLAALRDATTPLERLRALLAIETAFAVSPDTLAAAANLRATAVRALLAKQKDLRPLPDAAHAEAYTTAEKWQQLREAVRAALAAFHRAQPRQRGMDMESLRSQLAAPPLAADLTPKVFRAVVEQLARDSALVREDTVVRLPTHQGGLSPAETELGARLAARLAEAGLTPPDVRQVAADLGIAPPRLPAILAELERAAAVARADTDLYFAADAVERARALIRDYAAAHGGEITAAQFRDLIGASRKFSIGLLTYFDRSGFTLRLGDVRKVRG